MVILEFRKLLRVGLPTVRSNLFGFTTVAIVLERLIKVLTTEVTYF